MDQVPHMSGSESCSHYNTDAARAVPILSIQPDNSFTTPACFLYFHLVRWRCIVWSGSRAAATNEDPVVSHGKHVADRLALTVSRRLDCHAPSHLPPHYTPIRRKKVASGMSQTFFPTSQRAIPLTNAERDERREVQDEKTETIENAKARKMTLAAVSRKKPHI